MSLFGIKDTKLCPRCGDPMSFTIDHGTIFYQCFNNSCKFAFSKEIEKELPKDEH